MTVQLLELYSANCSLAFIDTINNTLHLLGSGSVFKGMRHGTLTLNKVQVSPKTHQSFSTCHSKLTSVTLNICVCTSVQGQRQHQCKSQKYGSRHQSLNTKTHTYSTVLPCAADTINDSSKSTICLSCKLS